MTSLLKSDYGEVPASMGLDAIGNLIEVFVSPKGTWTILMTKPKSPACAIGSGTDWQFITTQPDKSSWRDS